MIMMNGSCSGTDSVLVCGSRRTLVYAGFIRPVPGRTAFIASLTEVIVAINT